MIVQGLCVSHGVYGMIIGFFYANGMKSGKARMKPSGFLPAWMMNGICDLTLNTKILALTEMVMFIPAGFRLWAASSSGKTEMKRKMKGKQT